MPRRQRGSFLNRSEIEDLRQVLIAIRTRVDRAEIVRLARVDNTDFDNFVSVRPTGAYKTVVPGNAFLHRCLSYVSQLDLADSSTVPAEIAEDLKKLRKRYFQKLIEIDHADPVFQLLASIAVVTRPGGAAVTEALAGSYYGYRFSAHSDEIYRSYFQIKRQSVYQGVPSFVNMFKEGETIRISRGNVLEIGGVYVLFGFTVGLSTSGAGSPPVGIKLVVLQKEELFKKPKSLLGLYISCNNDRSYNFGTMRFMRIVEKYDPEKIGVVAENDLPFTRDSVAIRAPLAELARLPADGTAEDRLSAVLRFLNVGQVNRSMLYFEKPKKIR